jgi:BASS family bile acid:Na+ symporter
MVPDNALHLTAIPLRSIAAAELGRSAAESSSKESGVDTDQRWIGRLAGLVHHHLLWLLIGSYSLAAAVPGPGAWIRSIDLGRIVGPDLPHVSVTSVLLSFLLFAAGLGVQPDRLARLIRTPTLLFLGLALNLLVPVAFILGTAVTLQVWHNSREVQEILVGLALIASMPIAGSSTAWVQNAEGDLALSIGLVVSSTCISPITTPLVLHAVGWMAQAEYAAALHHLASNQVGGFLVVYVLLPSLLGIAARLALGGARIARSRPVLKLTASGVLLVLCYANAALALPQTVRTPDWDYLCLMLVIVTLMCLAGFAVGAAVSRLWQADRARRASLMFGLGMNNNGTGLVVAAGALAHMPAVMVPIIFYNLVQHVVAGFADRFWIGDPPDAEPDAAPDPGG